MPKNFGDKFEQIMGISLNRLIDEIYFAKEEKNDHSKEYSYDFVNRLLEMIMNLNNKIAKLENRVQEAKSQKYNTYLERLVEGGIPVELNSSDPEAVEALEIVEGDCCYREWDFGSNIYNNGNGVYIIVW